MISAIRRTILNALSKRTDLKGGFIRRNASQVETKRQVPRERPAVRKRGTMEKGGLPLLIIPITTFCLGTWQVRRREWKVKLIDELQNKMLADPIELPVDLSEVKELEYRRVKVKGRFDHSKELYVGPRSSRHAKDPGMPGVSSGPGVCVITPFKLSDRDETILVNRGHVSFKNRPPQMRKAGQITDEVSLVGIVRKTERKPLFEGDPAKDGYWLYTDVDELAEAAETSSVLIDADVDSTVPGGPVGGQTNVNLRNEHLSYIFTWYTLCALSSYMWYRQYRRPMPHKAIVEFVKKNHHRM